MMEDAHEAGEPEAAEIVAAECVTLAETKDHLNWELLGEAVKKLSGAQAKALRDAHEEVEEEEDEHLYHTQGWTRELWMQCLGAGGGKRREDRDRCGARQEGSSRYVIGRGAAKATLSILFQSMRKYSVPHNC